jgi:hypothetical protein
MAVAGALQPHSSYAASSASTVAMANSEALQVVWQVAAS